MYKKEVTLPQCLQFFPLRVALTDYCNIACFFCSNEGMPLSQKNKSFIDTEKLKYLIETLSEEGLRNISFTGGEPVLHPDIEEIARTCGKLNFERSFFHTNGILLTEGLSRKLAENFNKIAVSIHSARFETWSKITRGSKEKFKKLMRNLEILSQLKDKTLIELKSVLIKDYNDSEEELKSFLALCNAFKFKFKFLNLEPIIPSHTGFVIPFERVKEKLISVGAEPEKENSQFRGQSNYLPIKRFKYKDTRGVAIEIGCGKPEVCEECYRSNEIFVTPELKIKPCHMTNHQIDLLPLIEQKDKESIFETIVNSRRYLAQAPGRGLKVWQNI